MNKHECTIGVWRNYEDSHLVTASDVVWEGKAICKYNKNHRPLTAYFDKRCTTALKRFDYCPVCGKKIDWAALREAAKNDE